MVEISPSSLVAGSLIIPLLPLTNLFFNPFFSLLLNLISNNTPIFFL